MCTTADVLLHHVCFFYMSTKYIEKHNQKSSLCLSKYHFVTETHTHILL